MTLPDPAARAGAILTIDLDAIVANYRLLCKRAAGRVAGVVKADAYGLGMAAVAPALAQAGCRSFFVAHLNEAIALRALLADAEIAVLNGLMPGTAGDYRAYRLLPVLNDLGQIETWQREGAAHGATPAILHVDTGMVRLGLTEGEVQRLAARPERLAGVPLAYIMSHLACADEPDHPLNAAQLGRFRSALAQLPVRAPASLANSAGVFLGPAYQFDLVRPGIAVYGGNPLPGQPNPMRATVRLQARILQVRSVDSPLTVGYGATYEIVPPAKLATIAVGYADGFPRASSNRGSAAVGGTRVPMVGRVSMDLIVLDVTAAPAGQVHAGALVDLIGPEWTLDEAAAAAGTIAYEILTGLGRRYHRRYTGSGAGAP
ncbi:MAG: alanine racemase [Alphaproteobacteria bacterium]|nr:alanine racemase [Alphaproteobacteria bacterium]